METTEIDLKKEVSVFRGPISRGLAASEESPIDRTGGKFGAGLIRGFSVITRGEALGHGMFVDQEMLSQVADAINASGGHGIKSRFAHPDMSGDGIGKMTGKSFDAKVVGDQAFSDLHLLQSAHTAPDGDLAGYVMDLADEAPEDFGTSIAFIRDTDAEEAFVNANLVEYEAPDYNGKIVKKKRFASPDPKNTKNLRHTRLKKLKAVDVVDDPAANPAGMFHSGPFDLLENGDAAIEFALGLTEVEPDMTSLGIDAARLRGFVQRFSQRRGIEFSVKEPEMSDKEVKPNETEQKPADAKPADKPAETLSAKPAEKPADVVTETSKPADAAVDLSQAATDRAADIVAACNLAGKSDLALGFIKDPKANLSTVLSSLQAGFVAERKPVADAGQGNGGEKKAPTPDDKYGEEYDASSETFSQMGITREGYIKASKIRDTGKWSEPKKS